MSALLSCRQAHRPYRARNRNPLPILVTHDRIMPGLRITSGNLCPGFVLLLPVYLRRLTHC